MEVIISTRTVERTLDDTASFTDESPRPGLMNLVAHTNKKHANKVAEARAKLAAGESGENVGAEKLGAGSYSGATRSIMDKFREEGLLNPKREPTRQGFILMLASWIMDDDLPFTTCKLFEFEGYI